MVETCIYDSMDRGVVINRNGCSKEIRGRNKGSGEEENGKKEEE